MNSPNPTSVYETTLSHFEPPVRLTTGVVWDTLLSMLTHGPVLLIGLVVLIAGAESLVRGAVGIALLAKMTPSVVALTVVAAGTSMPELVVSARAAMDGNPGLALGNAVGSNLLNIGMALGLTALLRPLLIKKTTIRFEWPVMMLATLLFLFMGRDRGIDRLEGAFLTSALVAFTAYAVFLDRRGMAEVASGEAPATASFRTTGWTGGLLNGGAVALGVGLLAMGARALVRGAVGLATSLGVSETVIGLTAVAMGTSAPELVTSVVAAVRGRGDMAVGNIVGSCVFNFLGIVGVTALIQPAAGARGDNPKGTCRGSSP